MRRFLASFIVVATLLLTPGVAQAWVTVDENTRYRRVTASGWTKDYLRIQFYAGHDRGTSGTFAVTYWVDCARGFEAYWHDDKAHDTRSSYWSRIVKIPYGQRRCYETIKVIAVNPRNTRLTAGISAR